MPPRRTWRRGSSALGRRSSSRPSPLTPTARSISRTRGSTSSNCPTHSIAAVPHLPGHLLYEIGRPIVLLGRQCVPDCFGHPTVSLVPRRRPAVQLSDSLGLFLLQA